MNSVFFYFQGTFLSICKSQAVEYVELKGDIVLFNGFTILVNILIITDENKCTLGAGLLSWFLFLFLLKLFNPITYRGGGDFWPGPSDY